MCGKALVERIIPFVAALFFSVSVVALFQESKLFIQSGTMDKMGAKSGREWSGQPTGSGYEVENRDLRVISISRPNYTESARTNKIQGTVILRVTFLANGQIGEISPVKTLPDGLTEEAVKAVRQINFLPAVKNGESSAVTKSVHYNFTLY